MRADIVRARARSSSLSLSRSLALSHTLSLPNYQTLFLYQAIPLPNSVVHVHVVAGQYAVAIPACARLFRSELSCRCSRDATTGPFEAQYFAITAR